MNAIVISMQDMTKLMAPQMHPNITKIVCRVFLRLESSLSCVLLYIHTGRMKARAVQANEPIRLIKRPNLGTIMAPVADNRTSRVLKKRRFVG